MVVSSAPPPSPVLAAVSPPPLAMPEPSPVPEPSVPPANVHGESDEQPVDILELTESMTAPMPAPSASRSAPTPRFRTIDSSSDVGFDELVENAAPNPVRETPPQLLSPTTSAAVDSAFNTLAQTVLVQNARTLEDLVREMLRPMLKNWLDENLPGMVERLVRSEIERVSRGR